MASGSGISPRPGTDTLIFVSEADAGENEVDRLGVAIPKSRHIERALPVPDALIVKL